MFFNEGDNDDDGDADDEDENDVSVRVIQKRTFVCKTCLRRRVQSEVKNGGRQKRAVRYDDVKKRVKEGIERIK